MLVPILAGAVLGGLLCMVARRRRVPDEMRILAVGLAVAALIYVGFALAGADRRWLAIEAVGLAGFAGIAWLGLRGSAWWLALGWAVHAGWDVGLHLDRAQSIVGAWYPLSCVGFDLVVAGFVLSAAAAVGPRH
ncbi:MAG TPA: DUF6010 family protein [Gemmatimonadales bacterium]|nr:DUF6010 family protein [Gemmatimonadales bacterium]